ncbi:MAG: hypothetical protein V8T10_04115 [Merdibacter sp.]
MTYEERGTYLIGAYEFIFAQRQEDVQRRISDLAVGKANGSSRWLTAIGCDPGRSA